MKLKDLKYKTILILGYGKEGKATYDFLKKHFPDKKIGITDKFDGKNYLDTLKDYDVIIKSPGIPYLPDIKKAKVEGKLITSATNLFFENCKGKIIGVTGTKGKSTTASLIYEVLKNGGLDVYLVGNIGQPPLDLLDKISEDSIIVYELSSFQLEGLTVSPQLAVITNIYPEHLDHHGDFENYKNAKANISRFQTEEDLLIYNSDVSGLKEIADSSKAQKVPFTQKFKLDNTFPAVHIGKLFDISEEKINQAINNFKGLPHRLEFVGEFKGIKFYNDSLATNPVATIAAIDTLGDEVETLIAGGYDRGLDYSVLSEEINKSNIKNLILFPDTGEKIGKGVSAKIRKYNVDSMEKAVKLAFEKTTSGKICLMSPASASFNMFKNYEDRGNQFKKWIIKLRSN